MLSYAVMIITSPITAPPLDDISATNGRKLKEDIQLKLSLLHVQISELSISVCNNLYIGILTKQHNFTRLLIFLKI